MTQSKLQYGAIPTSAPLEVPNLALQKADGRETSMSFEFLVGLLIHEALHDTVRVDGEILSCDDEHRCMAILGDTMYYPLGDLSFWQCSISY